jgi:hypothetical protein
MYKADMRLILFGSKERYDSELRVAAIRVKH